MTDPDVLGLLCLRFDLCSRAGCSGVKIYFMKI